jgi:hypothetical protein
VKPILSVRRATPEIETIYALVVKSKTGREGIIRRTPYGTPLMTDDPDPEIHRRLLELAHQEGFPDAYLVEFHR